MASTRPLRWRIFTVDDQPPETTITAAPSGTIGAGLASFDPTPAVATFAVDTTPPETTITEAPSGTIGISSASFAFTASEPGTFECRLDSDRPR